MSKFCVEVQDPDKFSTDKEIAIKTWKENGGCATVIEYSLAEWKQIVAAVDEYIDKNFV